MTDCSLISTKMSSYGLTARVVLEEKGVPYRHDIIEPDEIKSPDYLRQHHPFGMMPAFSHGNFHLFETAAIARYVDEAFDGPRLQPEDPKARAQMQKWISISDNYIYPAVISDLVLQRLAPRLSGTAADEAVVASAIPKVKVQLDLLESTLADWDFLIGDVSLADFFAASMVQYVGLTPEGADLLADKPRISKWLASVTGRPSYEKATYDLGL